MAWLKWVSWSAAMQVNPDEIVSMYGADAMRLYEMFMGPLEAVKPWSTEQISGLHHGNYLWGAGRQAVKLSQE